MLKIEGAQFLPLGTPREELERVVQSADVPEATRAAVIQSSREAWKRFGIDPDRPQHGAFRGEDLFTVHVVDYFRVEPLSSVLTLFIATGSLLTATTGLVVAVVALWG